MFRHYEDKMRRGYDDKGKKPFIVIASGPSLTREDVEYVKGKGIVIVINDNYKMAPWADYLYFCDPKWFEWHKDKKDLANFKGKKYTQDAGIAKAYGINYIESKPAEGISESPDVIHQGSNSGYQAINLAYHLGARKIILLGYDMQTTNGKSHWFGNHPDNIISKYKSLVQHFESLAEHAKRLDLEIINCTRKTALTCFPKMKLESALSSERVQV